jgi:hypothetical protein
MLQAMPWSTARILALAIPVSFGLACGGVDSPPKAPLPEPVDNAGDCATFKGTPLPMTGGSIVDCSKRSVTIDHGEDARPLRWDYLELYKANGWSLSDPDSGNPVATRGAESLLFLADGTRVTVKTRKNR